MKAHRWYSAFRNVGIWALGVVVALAAISSWIDYPERHSALDLMSLIGLMALPFAFFAGVFFPFRSEAEISRCQTIFGWLVGALFGTVVAFGTLILCDHYMSRPYVPDEQLFVGHIRAGQRRSGVGSSCLGRGDWTSAGGGVLLAD